MKNNEIVYVTLYTAEGALPSLAVGDFDAVRAKINPVGNYVIEIQVPANCIDTDDEYENGEVHLKSKKNNK